LRLNGIWLGGNVVVMLPDEEPVPVGADLPIPANDLPEVARH
jgi:hypothetical protein